MTSACARSRSCICRSRPRLSRATVIKVARAARRARSSSSARSASQDRELTVEAHTIRVDAGRAAAGVTERGQLTDLFELHDRLVRDLRRSPRRASRRPGRGRRSAPSRTTSRACSPTSPAARATFLETALQDHPAFERARLSLWEVRTDQGDHAAALAAIRPIPATSPLFARARFFAATSMLNLQRYDEAFETYGGLLANGRRRAPPDGPMRGAVEQQPRHHPDPPRRFRRRPARRSTS